MLGESFKVTVIFSQEGEIKMGLLDVFVLTVYFAALIAVGIIGTKKAKTSEIYMVAGRNLGVFMFFGCLTAVFLGGSSTIGTAQLGYENGVSGVWFVFSMGLGIMLFGLLLYKRVIGYRLMTISEFLGKRFNVGAKLIGATVAAIYALMVSVTQVIAIGSILNAVFGWDLMVSMLVGGGIVFFLHRPRRYVVSLDDGHHPILSHDDRDIFCHVAAQFVQSRRLESTDSTVTERVF